MVQWKFGNGEKVIVEILCQVHSSAISNRLKTVLAQIVFCSSATSLQY